MTTRKKRRRKSPAELLDLDVDIVPVTQQRGAHVSNAPVQAIRAGTDDADLGLLGTREVNARIDPRADEMSDVGVPVARGGGRDDHVYSVRLQLF